MGTKFFSLLPVGAGEITASHCGDSHKCLVYAKEKYEQGKGQCMKEQEVLLRRQTHGGSECLSSHLEKNGGALERRMDRWGKPCFCCMEDSPFLEQVPAMHNRELCGATPALVRQGGSSASPEQCSPPKFHVHLPFPEHL